MTTETKLSADLDYAQSIINILQGKMQDFLSDAVQLGAKIEQLEKSKAVQQNKVDDYEKQKIYYENRLIAAGDSTKKQENESARKINALEEKLARVDDSQINILKSIIGENEEKSDAIIAELVQKVKELTPPKKPTKLVKKK